MINCKKSKTEFYFFQWLRPLLFITVFVANQSLPARQFMNEYLKSSSQGKTEESQKILNEWQPKSFEEQAYKKYFSALRSKNVTEFWSLYQELVKRKKMLKLKHECIKNIIQIDLASEQSVVKEFKNFGGEVRKFISRMRGLPDGYELTSMYFQWLKKYKNTKELCHAGRQNYISHPDIKLSEIISGFENCPIRYDDFISRIRRLIFSGKDSQALSEIKEFSELKKLKDWEQAYLKVVYYTNSGDPTEAYKIAMQYESEIKKSDEDNFLNLSFISQRAGELVKAEEILNELIDKISNSEKKKDLLFQKGLLFYQTKRYVEAGKIFSDLIKKHPSYRKKNKSKEFDELTWLRAWCYFLSKDYKEARDYLIENKSWTQDKARNLYWLAQSEWLLDNQYVALSYFRELALPVLNGKFFSYYNYLGWVRFETQKSYISESTLEALKNQLSTIKSGRGLYILPDAMTSPKQLVEVYESYFEDIGATDESQSIDSDEKEVTADGDEVVVEDEEQGIEVANLDQFKREVRWAEDLINWGHRDLAKWHLYEIEKTLKKKYTAEPLIEYYSSHQYYNRALSLMNTVSSPAGKALDKKLDPLLWESLFPKAYQKTVDSEARKRKVHPYMIWSIMKAETQFKEDAISPVGAIGLMQFMPYTSKKVAKILEEKYENDTMFNPKSAIRYGATYLKKLSEELGAQMPLVAAAYNGGPHRVKLWLRNLKERDNKNLEYDIFIEHIPFAETRAYVKKVVNYNLIYQKLYEDKLDIKSTKWLIEKIPYVPPEPVVLKEEWAFGG